MEKWFGIRECFIWCWKIPLFLTCLLPSSLPWSPTYPRNVNMASVARRSRGPIAFLKYNRFWTTSGDSPFSVFWLTDHIIKELNTRLRGKQSDYLLLPWLMFLYAVSQSYFERGPLSIGECLKPIHNGSFCACVCLCVRRGLRSFRVPELTMNVVNSVTFPKFTYKHFYMTCEEKGNSISTTTTSIELVFLISIDLLFMFLASVM